MVKPVARAVGDRYRRSRTGRLCRRICNDNGEEALGELKRAGIGPR